MVAGWCGRKKAMAYMDVKDPRVFRRMLKNGLRFSKLPVSGEHRNKYEWLDEYLERFEVKSEERVIAEYLVEKLRP